MGSFAQVSAFYCRTFFNILALVLMATYGMIAAILFPLFGCSHLIQYSVAKGYYLLGHYLCGMKVVAEGLENLPVKGPAIYVCNHQSSIDIMLMGKVYPKNTTVVAKKELKYYPFLGWFMQLARVVFLDRKNRENAVKESRLAAEDIKRKNINVWIYPEGTRRRESEITLLPFKKGPFYMAVQAQVPIIPVVLGNYSHLYNTTEKIYRPGTIPCKILPPISTKNINESSADIDELSTECRRQMLKALLDITSIKNKEI